MTTTTKNNVIDLAERREMNETKNKADRICRGIDEQERKLLAKREQLILRYGIDPMDLDDFANDVSILTQDRMVRSVFNTVFK